MNDEHIKWLKQLLEKIDERQDKQAETLSRLTTSVELHVKRTDTLEGYVKERIPPLEKLAERAVGVGWAVGIIVSAVLAANSLGLLH